MDPEALDPAVLLGANQEKPPPLTLVIWGASGDLTHKKILPALAALAGRGALPERFAIVGVARTPWSDEDFAKAAMASTSSGGPRWQEIAKSVRYVAGEYDHPDTFSQLAKVLGEVDKASGTQGNVIHYLATVPEVFAEVAAGIGREGLNPERRGHPLPQEHPKDQPGGTPSPAPNEGSPSSTGSGVSTEPSEQSGGDSKQARRGFVRLVVEKPFGRDLQSAIELDKALHEWFDEEQIYRIDHYMGKETVQNLLALRFANAIFEPVWNRLYVDHVQVTVAEQIGVEHRGGFYEHAGALRDIVQNHVMQVVALTFMEPPARVNAAGIRDEKVKLLRAIEIMDREHAINDTVRGQYEAGWIEGKEVPGYREEEGVSPRSMTETYVAMKLSVDNWRWAGVPVYVRTGKRLPMRVTEVALRFQRVPHLPFAAQLSRELEPNTMVVRIQPEEGISVGFGAKVPGQAFRVRSVRMDFSYDAWFSESPPDAYERLLLDAMIGDPTLFIRTDEVEQAWRIVDPVLEVWAANETPLARYEAGTWGPVEADRLIERDGRKWHRR